MSLPQFAPFPDAKVRQSIAPTDWKLYLDSWTSLTELYLRLDDQQFASARRDVDSLGRFLISFFHELAGDDSLATRVALLRKKAFYLLHRIWSGQDIEDAFFNWPILADICHVFTKSEQFRRLLQTLWKRKGGAIEKSLQTAKNSLIRNLDSKRPEEAEGTLNRIAPLMKASPDASIYMLTGSDFLDSLYNAYPKVPPTMQKKLVTTAYLGLTATLEGEKPNYSLLSDHLYSLKSTEEQEQKKESGKKTLVADLVTNTPLLEKIRDRTTAPEASRVKNTVASLSAFRQSSVTRPKRLVRRKVDKGKSKAVDHDYGHGAFSSEVHIHRMSVITQIQDLFPDLGAGFVVRLLDEYNDNVEEVTAHLLEGSLPPHLAEADRSEQLYTFLSSLVNNLLTPLLGPHHPQCHSHTSLQGQVNGYLSAIMFSMTMSLTNLLLTHHAFILGGGIKTSRQTRSCQIAAKHLQSPTFLPHWRLSIQMMMNETIHTTSKMLAHQSILLRLMEMPTLICQIRMKRRSSVHLA
jgi:activating signal cointegrator complex subunit 2